MPSPSRRASVAAASLSLVLASVAGGAQASGPTVLTTCDAAALAAAVTQGGTIQFAVDCPNLVLAGTLTVPATRTVDLQANGHAVTLNGNQHRLFSVTGGKLAITGLTLTNGQVVGANGANG